MNVFERLWKDSMDIYRYIEVEVDNVTKSTEQLINTGVRCHYSGGSLSDIGEDGIPAINNSHKLFCSVNTVHEGDKVIITQHVSNKQITLMVGEGFPCNNGMQFSTKRSDTV